MNFFITLDNLFFRLNFTAQTKIFAETILIAP